MVNINQYSNKLKQTAKTMSSMVNKVVISQRPIIISTIQNRLYGTGIDGVGKLIGNYKQSTITRFSKNTTFITLRNKGDWYKGMFVKSAKFLIEIFSRDEKNDLLTDNYGQNILSLTSEEENNILNRELELAMQSKLDSTASEIDLEIKLQL